jgi:hypothetical protein
MAAVIPTSKTRAAIVHRVSDLKGTISRTKEIVDNAKRMARPCPEVEKDMADMRESSTRRSINHLKFKYHQQPRTPPRAIPGRHPTNEKKIGEVPSGSKPTKLGRRSITDGSKTF